MREQTFTFPSSSDPNTTYTAIIATDGKLLCNCRGWTVRRGESARHCTHTKRIAGSRPVVTHGEFTYLADGAPVIKVVPTHRTSVGAGADPAPSIAVPPPMLATAITEPITGANFDARYASGWALEEKLDGHRLIVRVRAGRKFSEVEAFARPQRGQTAKARRLPDAMVDALASMGDCMPDGELVAPSGKSWDVVVKGSQLVFVAFDLLECGGISIVHESYETRRALLLERLGRLPDGQQSVSTVVSRQPTWADIHAIWARGGEGAILKRLSSRYQPGARSADWLKVKPEEHAEMVITGFEAGKTGPYSKLCLRDAAGRTTTVKTLGNQLLRDITRAPATFVGRVAVIAYQELTPDGKYRHGRFDHFVKE